MWVWVDRLAGLVLDAAFSATVLLALVALAMLGCRQPARRVRLARAATLCVLGVIPVLGLVPWPRVDLVQVLRSADILPKSSDLLDSPGTLPDILSPTAWAASWPWASAWPARAIALLYIAGVAYGFAGLLLGCGGLYWLLARSGEPSVETTALYQSLPFSSRRGRPRLRISARVRRPVLLGTLRQTILIPPSLDVPAQRDALRLSLLHELAHSRARDPWFRLAANLAQAVWFFVPPLWWICAQMRLDHEFLADRRAALAFGPVRTYASALLDLANPAPGVSGARPTNSPTNPEGAASALFQRLLMLVHCPFPVESDPPPWWRWSLPSLVILAALAASSLCLRAPEALASAPSSAVSAPSPPRVFRVARLRLPEQPANPSGRAMLFELPMRLPVRFDLSLDVWGDAATLAQTRVVGQRLAVSIHDDTSPTWHHVRVQRDASGLRLWVDDRPIPLRRETDKPTTWLSVEPPPNQAAQFKNLVLTW